MKRKLLYKLFSLPAIGNRIKVYMANREGGMQISEVLRAYTEEKYNVCVGLYSYGGCFKSGFNTGGRVEIGRYCSFASDIHYFGANHPINHVSMSPYFYNAVFSSVGGEKKDVERETLVIENDVWIGYGVIITNKCHKIGNGAVVAAGAVVTKDVPPYAIVCGSPAKIIRYRFDNITIEMIQQSKWWEKEPDEIMKHYQWIDKPEEFCNRLEKKI